MGKNKIEKEISVSKKITYALIAIVLALIAVEMVIRLLGFFPTEKIFEKREMSASWQENLFAAFMGIHEPDPVLLWKMKPNLNKTFVQTNSRGLVGSLVPYEKDSTKLRILLLGDSTPLGIGLKNWNSSFVWLLREFLEQRLNRKVEIINASTAGYTSLQGLKYLKTEGIKYKPDFVLVYLGNNDASYNGYVSDSALMVQASQFIGVKKFLNNFKLYKLLKSIIIPLKSKAQSHAGDSLQVRVTPHEFQQNLQQIVKISEKNGARVILNSIPVPLTWPPGVEFKVFTTGRDSLSGQLFMPESQRDMLNQNLALALDWDMFESNYGQIDSWSKHVLQSAYSDSGDAAENISRYHGLLANDPENVAYLNNLGVACWQDSLYDSALVYITDALKVDADNPVLLYNMGMTYRKMEVPDSSEKYLNKALDDDFNSLRIKSDYINIIRRVAGEDSLPLVDLDSAFERLGRETLFVDHCHPNQTGHRIIAEQLADEIVKIVKKE
jgi:lysophospholipase L1-like esterase